MQLGYNVLYAFKSGSLIITDDECDLTEVFTKIRKAIQENKLPLKLSQNMKMLVFKKTDLTKIMDFKYVKQKTLQTLSGEKLISSVLEVLWKSSEVVQSIEFIKLFTSVNDNMPWNEVLDGPV